MKELIGKFEDHYHSYEWLVCTTNKVLTKNNRLVMGAGIARWFRDTFPGIDKEFGALLAGYHNGVMLATRSPHTIVAFPTKYHWKQPSDMKLIENSLQELVAFVGFSQPKTILMTRPGCGMGKLQWKNVKPLCEKYLDDRFTVISEDN